MGRAYNRGFHQRSLQAALTRMDEFAVKLRTATEVYVVWPKGTLEAIPVERYMRMGEAPAGVLVFLDRGEAEVAAAGRIAALAEGGK